MRVLRFFLAPCLMLWYGHTHAQLHQFPGPLTVRGWAAACFNCHGTNGRAEKGHESLAGKPESETLDKLLAFKRGLKEATVMHQLARGYSDEQLQAIAGWFAAQNR